VSIKRKNLFITLSPVATGRPLDVQN